MVDHESHASIMLLSSVNLEKGTDAVNCIRLSDIKKMIS